jgi:hypothetical protein
MRMNGCGNMGTDLTFATGRFPQAVRFVLVNNRVPRADQHCTLCGGLVEKGYVRDFTDTVHLLRYAVLRGRGTYGAAHRQKLREESVMKCSNPDCTRGIGLVHYRRGWFSKRRYCSKKCRDAVVVIDRPGQSRLGQNPTTYFDWLFGQPGLHARPKLAPAATRTRFEPSQRFRWEAR